MLMEILSLCVIRHTLVHRLLPYSVIVRRKQTGIGGTMRPRDTWLVRRGEISSALVTDVLSQRTADFLHLTYKLALPGA